MTAKSTGWTPEKRARAAARLQNNKPWQKSTGPTTAAGKEAIKNNAYKHGFRSEDYREILRLLSLQSALVKACLKRHD